MAAPDPVSDSTGLSSIAGPVQNRQTVLLNSERLLRKKGFMKRALFLIIPDE